MFVSFLMPHEFHGLDARHLLVFYKQLQDFGTQRIAFIGSPSYFRAPADLATSRPEWQPSWRWMYEYDPPASLDDVRWSTLPAGLLGPRLSRLQSPLKLYRALLTRRLPEVEAAFAASLDHLGAGRTVDAVLLFGNLPSVEHVARGRGIPVIHCEVGPLRKPNYVMTGYWDRSGVNGRTEAAARFRVYRQEVTRGLAPPLLTRRQILCVMSRRAEARDVQLDEPGFPLGIALQTEDDSNLLAYSNGFGALDLIDLARLRLPREQVLVRHHPGQYARFTSSLAVIDDSPDAATFVERCAAVLTVNSSVAFEALLLGRRAIVLGDSPFRIASAVGVDHPGPEKRRLLTALNFLAFGYLVPYPLIFDSEYHLWRLSGPTESEIAARHLAWYRRDWPGPNHVADDEASVDTALALLAGGWPAGHSKSLVVFGAGSGAVQVIPRLRRLGFEVRAVLDSDSTRWGGAVMGAPVIAPTCLPGATVVIASRTYSAEMQGLLREIGYEDGNIVRLW